MALNFARLGSATSGGTQEEASFQTVKCDLLLIQGVAILTHHPLLPVCRIAIILARRCVDQILHPRKCIFFPDTKNIKVR